MLSTFLPSSLLSLSAFKKSELLPFLSLQGPGRSYYHRHPPRLFRPATFGQRRRCIICNVANLGSAEALRDSRVPKQKTYDVVSFGNLCVDIVMPVERLPPPDTAVRLKLLNNLSASPPNVSSWEVGGACNFMIAAARLGMNVGCIGQLADDVYGSFVRGVLQEEGVSVVEPVLPTELQLDQTLLCFVLVGPSSSHAFCSRYDFGPWPLVSGHTRVPQSVTQMLEATNAVYLNGFVFDELEPRMVVEIVQHAKTAGAAIFFDPGPRCWTLLEGERHTALMALMRLTDVLLMTQEEAVAVTGCSEPEEAARWVLTLPGTATQWCVVKLGGDGAMLCTKEMCVPYKANALKVDVKDTVGCGDSFAAAVVLGYVANHSIPTVMALANAVGAATAMGSGAGRNVAALHTVQDLLSSSVDEAADAAPCPHAEALQVLKSAVKISLDGGKLRHGNGAS